MLAELAYLSEIIGAIAVVASLFYVAIQIRQNTRAVRSATAQSVHEHYASWYHLLASDGNLSQFVVEGLRDYGCFSETDKAGFVATFMAFLSYSQNAFIKWREGSLSDDLWSGWERVMMNLVSAPGGQAFWKERGYIFGQPFQDYVENEIMTREPHPEARPMGAFSIARPPGQASE